MVADVIAQLPRPTYVGEALQLATAMARTCREWLPRGDLAQALPLAAVIQLSRPSSRPQAAEWHLTTGPAAALDFGGCPALADTAGPAACRTRPGRWRRPRACRPQPVSWTKHWISTPAPSSYTSTWPQIMTIWIRCRGSRALFNRECFCRLGAVRGRHRAA